MAQNAEHARRSAPCAAAARRGARAASRGPAQAVPRAPA